MAESTGLRGVAARGTLINAAFDVGVNGLQLVKGFAVAVFLTADQYGVWGILVVAVGMLLWLKQVGIGDKYVQQADDDQELAFQKAFTLELAFNGLFGILLALAVPLVALVFGLPELLAPGWALIAVLPAVALQTPIWVHYKRMRFARQRTIQAVDPLVAFVVTLGLAAAGAGYWSLVAGTIAGAWAGAAAALATSPYRLRIRYDRGTLHSYASFSWPLFLASASVLVIAQSSILVGDMVLGLAAVGAIALASQISNFTNRVDAVLSATLYPAVVAVRDRTDLLLESFVKCNRLALMWGIPFGIALTLFAPDLVAYVLGEEQWGRAVTLLQAFGALAALNHVAFNWDAYFRARAETRPIAVVAIATMVVFLATLPLMEPLGLDGLAIAMAAATITAVAARGFYLSRLFPGFGMVRQGLRAALPTLPAAGAVLLVRLLAEDGSRSAALAAGELVLYVAVAAGTTWALERPLLREMRGYLRRSSPHAAPPPPVQA